MLAKIKATQGIQGKPDILSWSFQIVEIIVNTLKTVFQKREATNNSIKKATFELVAINIHLIYKRTIFTTKKYKNK